MFQTFTIKPFIVSVPPNFPHRRPRLPLITDLPALTTPQPKPLHRPRPVQLTHPLPLRNIRRQVPVVLDPRHQALPPPVLRSPHLRTLAQEYTQEQALFLFLTKTERFGNNTIVPLSGTSSGKHMADDVEVMRRSREELGSGAGAAVRAFEKQLWG